jgi:hypothetical protein
MMRHRLVELVQMFRENFFAQQLLVLLLLPQVLAFQREPLPQVLAFRRELLREPGPTLVRTLDRG